MGYASARERPFYTPPSPPPTPQLLALEAQVSASYAANSTTTAIAMCAPILAGAYFMWRSITFSGVFTAVAIGVALRDVLVAGFMAGTKRE